MLDLEIKEFLEKMKGKENNNNQNKNLKGIATKIPKVYHESLKILQKAGIIPSLSEAFRIGVEMYLKEQVRFLEKLNMFGGK